MLPTPCAPPTRPSRHRVSPGHPDNRQDSPDCLAKGAEWFYWSCDNGPPRSGKLWVFKIWTPAVWAPLNGVGPPGHPAFAPSTGELNHNPRWYVWTGFVMGLPGGVG